jgi:hypothetical protein
MGQRKKKRSRWVRGVKEKCLCNLIETDMMVDLIEGEDCDGVMGRIGKCRGFGWRSRSICGGRG